MFGAMTSLLLLSNAGDGVKMDTKWEKFFVVGIAAIWWVLWKTRNKVCFKGKTLNNPPEVICHACACTYAVFGQVFFLTKRRICWLMGVNAMLQTAIKLLSKPPGATRKPNLIQDVGKDGDADQVPTSWKVVVERLAILLIYLLALIC